MEERMSNERPTKLWRTLDALYVVGLGTLVAIEFLYWVLVPGSSVARVAFFTAMPLFLGGTLGYYLWWYRHIWPEFIIVDAAGLRFVYAKGRTGAVRWDEITEVKCIGPGPPSVFGLRQAIVRLQGGRLLHVKIYGPAAVELERRFSTRREWRGRLPNTRG